MKKRRVKERFLEDCKEKEKRKQGFVFGYNFESLKVRKKAPIEPVYL